MLVRRQVMVDNLRARGRKARQHMAFLHQFPIARLPTRKGLQLKAHRMLAPHRDMALQARAARLKEARLDRSPLPTSMELLPRPAALPSRQLHPRPRPSQDTDPQQAVALRSPQLRRQLQALQAT